MANYERHSSGLPMIVKFVEHFHNGVQSHTLSRYAIGYIVRGEKHIYNGDKRQTISKGDVFFLGIGTHYTEEVPDESNTFEQILFYYQPADLHKILMYLNLTYGLNISYNHACPECQGANAVSTPAWQLLKGFFSNTANYLRGEGFLHDETAENIKMTELVYLIVSHDECCLRSKILGNIDTAKENFEQLMYDHIFDDISIDELAALCNPVAHFVQEGVQTGVPDAAAPVVHPPAAHARAHVADLDLEVHFADRQRVRVPQHVAFHQALQEGIRDDAGDLSQPAQCRIEAYSRNRSSESLKHTKSSATAGNDGSRPLRASGACRLPTLGEGRRHAAETDFKKL